MKIKKSAQSASINLNLREIFLPFLSAQSAKSARKFFYSRRSSRFYRFYFLSINPFKTSLEIVVIVPCL